MKAKLALFLYELMWYLFLPLALLRLYWRSRREPAYAGHVRERLACYPHTADGAQADTGWIWVHAVSVGETRAAQPLLQALLAQHPGNRILLTHMTPTGRDTGAQLFAHYGARVQQSYLPYDLRVLQKRFLRRFQPRLCILMETEVWPNLIAACRRESVPILLANARLSARSLRKAQRWQTLMSQASRGLSAVAAQTEADAGRIASLGAPTVKITGSIKFDVQIPPNALQMGQALRNRIGARPVWLCASTREGEEELLLDAFCAWRAGLAADSSLRQTLLLLVPRHPQRFAEVAQMVQARGLGLQLRSQLEPLDDVGGPSLAAQTQVLLGDSMGEMFVYCAACDLAFIGGSLQPLGGQNPIEACTLGKPVLLGPHTFNFDWISEQVIACGGARRINDAQHLLQEVAQLLQDASLRREMGQKAQDFAALHRGATARTMELLIPWLARRG